jgi:hypothetical protein
MAEVDYLIESLEQRRNAVRQTIAQTRSAAIKAGNHSSPEIQEYLRQLEQVKKQLNKSIEKLIFESN